MIDRNAKLQGRLIDDVLDVSRIISGKLRLDVRECDLAEVIREAVTVVQPSANAKGVRIDTALDPSVGCVPGDPARLQQVVWNLLSNAVKFTPRAGRIRIELTPEAAGARIEVRDTGSGISPEFLPFVFDRFRQADSTTRRKFGGLGLGLSIVKQLVELHGGTVSAESAGEGQGATFTIILPTVVPQKTPTADERPRSNQSSAALPSRSKDPGRLDGLRIVLVDDDADARRLMTRMLGDVGATVAPASTVAEGLRAVATVQPHVLVSDIAMPDEDGHDLIRQVRASGHSVESLPAVALTAFAGKGYEHTSLLAGFQLHVVKPVDPTELISAIAGLAKPST